MYRKSYIGKQTKAVSKQIKTKFGEVLASLQLDLRRKNVDRHQNLEKMQAQVKKMAIKINQFSNLLLQDKFKFQSLEQHPLIMVRYCQIMFTILIESFNSENRKKTLYETQKSYNQNNVYEVVAANRLQNFDLKDKIRNLQKQLELSRQRAQITQEITQSIRTNTQNFLKDYENNFVRVCDLLKKAQNAEVQLLQNNRYLKQQLQSLSIQFERYKQYFKQGPTLKQKQYKMKNQLEKQYEFKLKNIIKQVQVSIRNQLQKSVVQKFNLRDIKDLKI